MKYTFVLWISLLSAFSWTGCGNDEPINNMNDNSITGIAAANADLSTLSSALERTGLDEELSGQGTYTIFAPTNAAFTASGIDLDAVSDQELKDILLYHVLEASVRSGDVAPGLTYVNTASLSGPNNNALTLLIDATDVVTINNTAQVSTANISADNGVVHIVDQLILPLDIVGHASANINFSTLVGALSTAPGELVNVLSGDGPFTVFAPVNAGFESISDVVAGLTPDQLSSVLTYHVIGEANIMSTDLSEGEQVTTINGQSVTVSLDGGVKLVDAGGNISKIIATDVQATNGVIHAIENVIIPTL